MSQAIAKDSTQRAVAADSRAVNPTGKSKAAKKRSRSKALPKRSRSRKDRASVHSALDRRVERKSKMNAHVKASTILSAIPTAPTAPTKGADDHANMISENAALGFGPEERLREWEPPTAAEWSDSDNLFMIHIARKLLLMGKPEMIKMIEDIDDHLGKALFEQIAITRDYFSGLYELLNAAEARLLIAGSALVERSDKSKRKLTGNPRRRKPNKSQYELYKLPFFNAKSRSTWDVKPSGNYTADCKTGAAYAQAFLRSCDGTVGWSSLLGQIVSDMIGRGPQGQTFQSGHRSAGGLVIGFMGAIGRALCVSR